MLPTPAARDWKSSASNLIGTNARPLNEVLADIISRVDENGGIDWGDKELAIRRWEAIHGPHPFPGALGPKMGVKPAPEFVEWMMGLEPGHVSSADYLTINEKLRLLGNGVVPPQAESAIRQLLTALNGDEENTMTSTDTSSFFTTHQTRDVPRDQWGRYKLPGRDGTEQSWTRATTFAATLAEQFGLRIWEQRQVVWGLSRRPDLLTMASTISGPEDKKALGEIVDEAHIAAGTKAKANRGTAIHRACQAAERGAYDQVPEELRPHVSAYFTAMRDGGLTILPEYVERTVIVDQYQVAGTFDNLVRCPDGKIRVSDKKTGRMDYSDTEFAVQMALYANADAIFNYNTGQYEPMPEVATDYAILAHIDPETGHCELLRINIEWGWVWARTCAETMSIRKTKGAITPYIAPELDGMDSTAMTPAQEARQPIPVELPPVPAEVAEAAQIMHAVNANANGRYTQDPATGVFKIAGPVPVPDPITAAVHAERIGRPPAGFGDPWGGRPIDPAFGFDGPTAEYQAFWSDTRHDLGDDEPAEQVNGVPLEQYGQPNQWGCARGEPCEFTGDEGLHADGTVCLYGNSRPGPVPPLTSQGGYEITGQTDVTADALGTIGEQEPVPGECPEMDSQSGSWADPENLNPSDAELEQDASNVDDIAKAMNKLSKGSAQEIARKVMAAAGVAEGKPGSIKLSQYKSKIINETITMAHKHGIEIPGAAENDPPFGTPTGPAPGAAGAKPSAAAQLPDDQREEKIRTAVESIRQQNSIAGLQERHSYYSGTSIGWTDEMQTAARTRAAELEAETGESPLSPMEMIQGATSRETLTKAWEKATNGGADMAGWTEALNAAAMAKQTELSAVSS